MFVFVIKMFITVTEFIGLNAIPLNVTNEIPLKLFSVSDQEYKVIPAIININSNEPLFYHCSVLVK